MTEEEVVRHRIATVERLLQQLRQTRQTLLELSGGKLRAELLAPDQAATDRLTAGLAAAQAKLAAMNASGDSRRSRKKK